MHWSALNKNPLLVTKENSIRNTTLQLLILYKFRFLIKKNLLIFNGFDPHIDNTDPVKTKKSQHESCSSIAIHSQK